PRSVSSLAAYSQPRRNLGQDLGRRVDEHPPAWNAGQPRVEASCVLHEVGELRKRLDACVAGADEDEREVSPPLGLVGGRVRRLELAEDVVSEVNGVGERL